MGVLDKDIQLLYSTTWDLYNRMDLIKDSNLRQELEGRVVRLHIEKEDLFAQQKVLQDKL